MENPFGHYHRRDDGEEEYPPPQRPPAGNQYYPPPYDAPPLPPPHGYGSYYEQPPPPPLHRPEEVTGVYHSSHASFESPNYPPPSSVSHHASHHVSHVVEPEQEHHSHSFRPRIPSYIQTHIHTGHVHESNPGSDIASRPSVRVYTKAETNHSLAIRDGQVILARSDPNDLSQGTVASLSYINLTGSSWHGVLRDYTAFCKHWIKDEKYSIKVKDEEGFPAFALVNKATGQAMKHSVGATHPVQLIAYNPDVLDESVLWTLSRDLGDGYRTIRMVNNIRLNVDAFHGNKNQGGVHDGTTIVLWEWKKGENQRWKIVSYCEFVIFDLTLVQAYGVNPFFIFLLFSSFLMHLIKR